MWLRGKNNMIIKSWVFFQTKVQAKLIFHAPTPVPSLEKFPRRTSEEEGQSGISSGCAKFILAGTPLASLNVAPEK